MNDEIVYMETSLA